MQAKMTYYTLQRICEATNIQLPHYSISNHTILRNTGRNPSSISLMNGKRQTGFPDFESHLNTSLAAPPSMYLRRDLDAAT
jgi:hypothetical protein